MGYMRHHAIILTSFDEKGIKKAHGKAVELFGEQVTNIVTGVANEYYSFMVGPDGSKEGWPASDEGDAKRRTFFEWLLLEYDKDNWVFSESAIVTYDEEGQARIKQIK